MIQDVLHPCARISHGVRYILSVVCKYRFDGAGRDCVSRTRYNTDVPLLFQQSERGMITRIHSKFRRPDVIRIQHDALRLQPRTEPFLAGYTDRLIFLCHPDISDFPTEAAGFSPRLFQLDRHQFPHSFSCIVIIVINTVCILRILSHHHDRDFRIFQKFPVR